MSCTSTRKTLRALAEARRGVLVPGAFNALSARVIEDLGLRGHLRHRRGRDQHVVRPARPGLHRPGRDRRSHGAHPRCGGTAADRRCRHRLRQRAERAPHRADPGARRRRLPSRSRTRSRPSAAAISRARTSSPTDEMVGRSRPPSMPAATPTADHGPHRRLRHKASRRRSSGRRGFAEAGADILFVEASRRREEVLRAAPAAGRPQLMNMVIGGKTPIFDAGRAGRAGLRHRAVRQRGAAGRGAGMQKALTVLRDEKEVQESGPGRSLSPSGSGWWASRIRTRWRSATRRSEPGGAAPARPPAAPAPARARMRRPAGCSGHHDAEPRDYETRGTRGIERAPRSPAG